MRYNKKELLEYIDVVSFAVIDALLYLDTHPNDENALEYLYNYQKARNQAVREYTLAFGPLNLDQMGSTKKFYWATQSWPWQMEG